MAKMIKTIEEFEAKANKIIEEAKKEHAEIDNEIDIINNDLESLYQEQKKAVLNNNSELYNNIVGEIEQKKKDLEFYKLRLKRIQNKDLINQDDYKKSVSGILEAFEEETRKAVNDIIQLCEQMYERGESLKERANYVNDILHIYQDDLYNNKDRKKDKYGKCIFRNDIKTVPAFTFEIIKLAQEPCNSYSYEKITGIKMERKNIKTWIH